MFRILDIFQKKALVLMYHRISKDEVDPWEIAVSAENFEAQLSVLKGYNIISLNDLVSQIQNKDIEKRCVAVTFDDGYADNYFTAKPLLQKYQVPATFFITSRNIDKEDEFWWDELAHIILTTKRLPKTFQIAFKEKNIHFDLKEETQHSEIIYNQHKRYSVYRSTPTLRAQLYYQIWELLFPLSLAEQEELMTYIREWAQVPKSERREYRCMSKAQIAELVHNKLFTIGVHTCTHPALSFLDKEMQYKEIKENKTFLEGIAGNPVSLMAYPSGNFNETTIEAVRQVGLEACVTTNHKPVTRQTDQLQIGRFQVNNWSGQTFNSRLKSWFKL